jgi:Glycoside-hydrolase family GH114
MRLPAGLQRAGSGRLLGVGLASVWTFASLTGCNPPPPPRDIKPLPANAPFDYQIGGDYAIPPATSVVSRDWFIGTPIDEGYSICYVNAFQTQSDEVGIDRPDEQSNWPSDLVLTALGDDPNWGGEYIVDISTSDKRTRAAAWLLPLIATCKDKGFDAVEFDNLDSWTRFDETPLAGLVPFGQEEAVEFARIITELGHNLGLAVGQKNTADILAQSDVIGFDFAVVEECGEYDECGDFAAVYGADIIAIEYGDRGFERACQTIGSASSVVRRDVNVSQPDAAEYVYDEC